MKKLFVYVVAGAVVIPLCDVLADVVRTVVAPALFD